jgi:glycosyltransferase involved in cell wall biosynthesis
VSRRTRVFWQGINPRHEGNQYGYTLAIERTRAALADRVTFVDTAAESDVVVTYIAPHSHQLPTPGKRNVLATMFESPDLPEIAIQGVRNADALIVPSGFCHDIFRPHTNAPIHVVPLGIDPVPETARDPETRVWRWLWVGALNVRKGWPIVELAWRYCFQKRGDMELYIKTTTPREAVEATAHKHGIEPDPNDPEGVYRVGNMVFDCRNLPRPSLEQLYASSHGFVFPTLGEGWGLTLAEAMSSGLPCVATEWGGHLTFASRRTCRMITPEMKRLKVHKAELATTDDGKYEWGVADWRLVALRMEEAMQDYAGALHTGHLAAKHVRKFTWDTCAEKFAAVLKREARGDVRAAA